MAGTILFSNVGLAATVTTAPSTRPPRARAAFLSISRRDAVRVSFAMSVSGVAAEVGTGDHRNPPFAYEFPRRRAKEHRVSGIVPMHAKIDRVLRGRYPMGGKRPGAKPEMSERSGVSAAGGNL